VDSRLILPDRKDSIESIKTMLREDINCPLSSGMGRLFDGVSAMLGIREEVSYEGQGAVLLEAAAAESEGSYPVNIAAVPSGEGAPARYGFDSREMIRSIFADLQKGRDRGHIAADFMNTLAEMADEMCRRIREDTGLDRVVLSGGTFQNIYLLERITRKLERSGFRVFRHSRVSTNDEGISFGQAAVAIYKK